MGVADDCRKPFKHPCILPETNSSSLKIGLNDPKGNVTEIPTIQFQVRTVIFREGTSPAAI